MLQSAKTGDYFGRVSDLLAYDNAQPDAESLLLPALVVPGQSGALIAGVEKLVQRFILELLTELGSLVYLPERGCVFLLEARSGQWRTPADVEGSFNRSKLTIRRNLLGDELETDPDDERFADAELTSVALTGDKATLHISISSLAGSDRTFLLPLRVSTINPSLAE
jgi:hypothetical protein